MYKDSAKSEANSYIAKAIGTQYFAHVTFLDNDGNELNRKINQTVSTSSSIELALSSFDTLPLLSVQAVQGMCDL